LTSKEDAIVTVHIVAAMTAIRARAADERGEGVISMGVAILITVVIGALMFAGLRLFWEDMYDRIVSQIPGIS
jgi:Family of unknown function (DUF6133)